MAGALAGLRVLVTRSGRGASRLSAALAEVGAEPVEVPALRFEFADSTTLDAAIEASAAADWVLLTSRTTVDALASRYEECGAPPLARVAAVGPATAKHAEERLGCAVHLVPETAVAEALADQLISRGVDGAQVVFPRAEEAREMLVERLRAAGASVDVRTVYRSTANLAAAGGLRNALDSHIDIATVASSRTAEFLFEIADAEATQTLLETPFASIGPITTRTLERFGVPVVAEADPPGLSELVAAITEWAARR